jgi:hypothetical protein
MKVLQPFWIFDEPAVQTLTFVQQDSGSLEKCGRAEA